jgi:hypothetical protein
MTTLRTAALALALTAAAAAAHAGVKASAIRAGNWFASSPAEVFVPLDAAGATTLTFNLGSGGKKLLTYSAECAVDASVGETSGYLELDIYVNGVVVVPTGGSYESFCSSNGTTGFDGWVRTSITVPIKGIAGTNTIRIKARGNLFARGLWLGDSALAIYD